MTGNLAGASSLHQTGPDSRRIPRAASGFTLLAISSDSGDHTKLAALCAIWRWRFLEAQTCRQGLTRIRSDRVAVAICERDLPDGTWKAVLDQLGRVPAAPSLIVASRLADDALWAEVLNMGGHDVLVKPFEPNEVLWSVTSAHHRWESQTGLAAGLPHQQHEPRTPQSTFHGIPVS
jgi:DNA-binding response OmpR family regulator